MRSRTKMWLALLVAATVLRAAGGSRPPGQEGGSHPPVPAVEEIVRRVDQLYRSQSSRAEMEMTIKTPHWTRTLRLQSWTGGQDRTFITILEPAKERGISTLKLGREMWNFFPRIGRTMKVPPSMMMGSWMGSDFTNDDLLKWKTLLHDYRSRLLPPPHDRADRLEVELLPREQTVTVWGKIILVVRADDFLPVEQRYFDEAGQLARILRFGEIKRLGGRLLPASLELSPQNKPGHQTILSYHSIEFDQPVDPATFTLRNLERIR